MIELNNILTFRVDKNMKQMMAELKENHYNISSLVRSAVTRAMREILDSINTNEKERGN